MSDHLPECVDAMIPDFHNERWVCICAALRACEQRVREEAYNEIPAIAVYGERLRSEGYDKGHAAALDAARDAVAAASLRIPYEDRRHVYLDDALAAIDALRGEPNE